MTYPFFSGPVFIKFVRNFSKQVQLLLGIALFTLIKPIQYVNELSIKLKYCIYVGLALVLSTSAALIVGVASADSNPTIYISAPSSVTATGSNGAIVNYTTSATNVDGTSNTATCAPASGSTFPIGETTVTCQATDQYGNTRSASVQVNVVPVELDVSIVGTSALDGGYISYNTTYSGFINGDTSSVISGNLFCQTVPVNSSDGSTLIATVVTYGCSGLNAPSYYKLVYQTGGAVSINSTNPLPTPTNLNVSPGNGQTTVTWTGNGSSYTVIAVDTSNQYANFVVDYNATSPQTVSGFTTGDTYRIIVVDGQGANASIAAESTPFTVGTGEFTDIGSFATTQEYPYSGDGTSVEKVAGINSNDDVAATINMYGPQSVGYNSNRASLWIPDKGYIILQTPTQTLDSYANGINDNGDVAGCQTAGGGKTSYHIYKWAADGSYTDLGNLNGQFACAAGINNNGEIVATVGDVDNNGGNAGYVWTEAGGWVNIGSLGSNSTYPEAINNQGEVVGTSETASGVTHAFYWTPETGMVDLGSLAGASGTSGASGLNDNGDIVGFSQTSTGGSSSQDPVLWNPQGQITDLGLMNVSGATTGAAYAINDNEQVVGSVAYDNNGNYGGQAFTWTSTNGGSLLPGYSQSAYNNAYSINNKGNIAGTSTGIDNTDAIIWGENTSPISQTISFSSTPPNNPLAGETYQVSITGGQSSEPLTLSIDSTSTVGVCSVSGMTVSFLGAGTCVIDANQAGNILYSAATQVSQSVNVTASVPEAPDNVLAKYISNGQAIVTWSPQSANGSLITSYTVTANDVNNSNGNQTETVNTANPLTFRNLVIGDSYNFSVTSTNAVGTSSPSGSSNTIGIIDTPTGLTGPIATNKPPVLSWSSSTIAAYYNIYRNGVDIGSSNTNSFTDNFAPQGNNSYFVTAVSLNGAESPASNTINVIYDTTPPTITYTVSPIPNSNGWNNTTVTITFTCSDNGTGVGIASCTAPVTLNGNGSNQTVTGTAVDNAGNTTSVTTLNINIDNSVPMVDTPAWSTNPVVTGNNTTLTVPTSAAQGLSSIVAGEYYIGSNDPGQGNGIAMTFDNTSGNLTANIGSSLSPGTYIFNVRDENAAGQWSSTVTTALIVNPVPIAPTITSTNNYSIGVRQIISPSDFTFTTTGTPAPSLTETGTLPSGLIFADNGNGTANFSGMVAAGTAGSYPVTITATNSAGSVTQTFTLTISNTSSAPTTIFTSTGSNTLNATLNTNASFTFTMTGNGKNFKLFLSSGSIPPGMNIHDNKNGTGTISGIPTASGTYTFTIEAENNQGITYQQFTIIIS